MSNIVESILFIKGLSLSSLIEEYRLFFLALLPGIFILAVIVEYFDRLNPAALLRRAIISILILSSVTTFYTSSIKYSIDAANEKLNQQRGGNILLMDLFKGINHWNNVSSDRKEHDFYKDNGIVSGTMSFLKYHLFDKLVNDGFTVSVFFIAKLCFLIIKVVYSLIYYLGYGLIGVPCLIYLFPTMGNVLRGGVISYLWCLVLPHVLVFVLTLIGTEINKGYQSGQIIGGSIEGTVLLFMVTLFIAFTPIITAMILNGSGVAQAGGIIGTMGANWVMNLPKKGVNTTATFLTGGNLGPKMNLATSAAKFGFKTANGNWFRNKNSSSKNDQYSKRGNSTNRKSNSPHSNNKNITQKSSNEATNNRVGQSSKYVSNPQHQNSKMFQKRNASVNSKSRRDYREKNKNTKNHKQGHKDEHSVHRPHNANSVRKKSH